MKISLEDFNAKVGRKDIFKPTARNESLHETVFFIVTTIKPSNPVRTHQVDELHII
jgi:hypothetical protein